MAFGIPSRKDLLHAEGRCAERYWFFGHTFDCVLKRAHEGSHVCALVGGEVFSWPKVESAGITRKQCIHVTEVSGAHFQCTRPAHEGLPHVWDSPDGYHKLSW